MGHDMSRSRMVGRRLNVREIGAAVMFLLSPVLYFIFSETPKAALYQTTAEHGLLLITVPIGLVLVWLAERRPPAQGQQPTPVWARLMPGGATGPRPTVPALFPNATALRDGSRAKEGRAGPTTGKTPSGYRYEANQEATAPRGEGTAPGGETTAAGGNTGTS